MESWPIQDKSKRKGFGIYRILRKSDNAGQNSVLEY